jgi:4-amino-4-deoxy-L-arabinose transferase-like glycosyltransferase
MKRNLLQLILFILVFTGLSLIYNYPKTLLKPPQSVHNWRQCDGLSLALSYHQEGMHFFKPQTHMLYSDGSTTGNSAPSEAPLFYYFIALLYHLFGYHEYFFRAVNLLIFLTGLYFLYRFADKILPNSIFPVLLVVLIFSSPVLIYYGNNFLPNTSALAVTFIAWYFFYKYYENSKTGTFITAMMFFALAGLMKVTELISVIIILGMFLAEKFRIISFNIIKGKHFAIKIIAFVFVFLLCGSWIMYARYYNNLHASGQFMTYTVPIWDLSRTDIRITLEKIQNIWYKEYFYPPTLYFLLGALLLTIIMHKYTHRILTFSSVCLVLGWAVYSLLFFGTLGDHDYFYITFYILPALVFMNLFYLLKHLPMRKTLLRTIQVFLILFICLNVIYGSKRHTMRYEGWMNDYKQNLSLYQISPWLRQNGITLRDSVIFYPCNYIRPLYLMNLKGWVIRNLPDADTEVMKSDSLAIKTMCENGARYLITNRLETALNYKPLEPYLKDLKVQFQDIYVFRIPSEMRDLQPSDTLHIDIGKGGPG